MAAILSLIDGAIVVAGMMVFGVKTGLYSVVAVFVTSKFTDRILEGLKFAKMLYIISSDPEFIARFVMEQLGRGVTALRGTGMYSGDEKKVRSNASTGILLLLGMGLVSTVIALLAARPAFTWFVAVPEEILEQTLVYFRIFVLGLVFQFGYNIFSSILRAVGDSAATLYFLLISSVTNVFLDILFVAGFHWGVAGAAIATDISQGISFVAAWVYMRRKYPVFRFRLREFTWDSTLARKTLQVGSPIALQMMIVSFGLTFIQRAVNGFGKTMTASFTVGQRIEMYINLPCNAFQTTMATYTGQNIGAGKKDRVKTGLTQTLLISLLMTIMISALIWIFSDQICGLFGLSREAAVYCNAHLNAVAFINIILSAYIPLFGVFQGANHPAVPTIVATCALGVRVAVTYLFRYSPLFGYTIIWWNGLFGFGTGCTVTWLYYLSGRWQRNASLT